MGGCAPSSSTFHHLSSCPLLVIPTRPIRRPVHNPRGLLMNNPRQHASSALLASLAGARFLWLAVALAGLSVEVGRAADSAGNRRTQLLGGEGIAFTVTQTEAERTLPASWLAEAARRGAAVNVSRAVFTGPLDLRHAAVTNRFRLNDCVFKDAADYSFAVFEQGFDFSDCQFAAAADFTGALARRAVLLRGTAFSGPAIFTDATAEDVFLAQGAAFLGKETKFNRATFLKSVGFGPAPGQPAASFSGSVTFEAARFAGAVDFNRVRFGGAASQTVFKEVRCERAATFRGAEFRGASTFGSAVFLGGVAFGPEGEGPGALPAVRFVGTADFAGAQFGGEAEFTQALFLRPTLVSFDGCAFKDHAKFGQAKFTGGVLFTQAKFGALADFGNAHFQGTEEGPAASFQDSEIAGRANFSGGQFGGSADFRNTRFGGETAFNGAGFAAEAMFTYAKFDRTVSFAERGGDVKTPGATFEGVTDFTGAQFASDAFFEGTKFTASTNSHVSFSAVVFGGETAFDTAKFSGDANFVRAQFNSAATFIEAAFLSKERPVRFTSIKAGKTLNFTGARFAGALDFTAAEAVGPVQFDGVVFEGDAKFNTMSVQRHAVFGPIGTNAPTRFKKTADFIAAHIGGQLDLAAARFDGDAIFRGATFQRGLILSWRPGQTGEVQAAVFNAGADFRNVQVGERVQIAGVTFHQTAAFDSAKWDVPIAFDGVRFRKGATLTRGAFPHGADFSGTRCDGLLDLTDSAFRTLRLTSRDQWTDGPVELRGAVYEQFDGNVDALLQGFSRPDRQALVRLEKTLRQAGRDDEADVVYLERQRRERLQSWTERSYGEWVFSATYATLGNYGVRPYRLLVFAGLIIWLGALVFQLPGAVVRKDKLGPDALLPTQLSRFDALALSVCYFLPVEFPLEDQWVAATTPLTVRLPFTKRRLMLRPAAIANFVLRIAGWVVMPLSLAAVTGMLKVNN